MPGAAESLECVLEPLPAYLSLGERPRFWVRITNRFAQGVLLVWPLDGSFRGRFPRVKLTYEGPSGAFEPLRTSRCGYQNDMALSDFFPIDPGQTIDLFGDSEFIDQYVHLREPGRYLARFEYSTAKDDLREWLGSYQPEALPDEFHARFRRVPRVVLHAECTFEVPER